MEDAREQVLYGLGQCDILKISDNEIQWLTGKEDYTDGVRWIRECYPVPLILVSMGKEGSRAYYKDRIVEAKPFLQPNTIETTGAGDTFCACVLHYVLEHGLEGLEEKNLKEMLRFANAAASLITTRKGVRIIDDREKEIENFKPEEYWNIDASFGVGRKTFTARLSSDAKGKKLLPHNEEEARAIEQGLQGAEYTVGELKKGKRSKQPTPAFITSTLQQEASRRLGFTATRTMRAAQTLYEGVDIAGHGTMGLITYMRTDSLRISDEAVAAAKEYIAGAYGENYICPYKRAWKTKSATAAQDAHEAIRPSVPSLTPDEVDQSISGDTAKLYRMIWSRFMASQMADCQQDTVSVTVYAGDYRFKASGYTVTFDGFTALYEEATDEKEKKETSLPPLEQGQVLKLKELKSEQKFTQPPARYTEATLIKALEENGIGRPSTYAPIITTIIDRGYVERDQKKLKPTLLGRAVDGLMLEQFPHIVDVDFSAEMEKNLDKVESGKADWHKTVDDFYQGFAASLEQAEKNMEGKKVKVPDEPSSEVCDLCGRPMVIKVGKYGKFLACSGFPECRGTKRLVKDTGGICPKCGKGRMLERKSAKGRIYYGCERYPDCDFMTWASALCLPDLYVRGAGL